MAKIFVMIQHFSSLFQSQSASGLMDLNPPWMRPEHCRLVDVWIRKGNGYIKVKGSYDPNHMSWLKANGVAIQILGWSE